MYPERERLKSMPSTSSPIELVSRGYDVSQLVEELKEPKVWNRYPVRLYGPHSNLSDVWVRYNDFANYDPKDPAKFNEPHDAVWYPVVSEIPSVLPLVFDVMHEVCGERLGG